MKVPSSLWLCCGLATLLVLLLPLPVLAAGGPQLVVDDDKVECPNAAFTRIQDAVDAASPGATIRVCKGNYAEQVAIGKPLTIAGQRRGSDARRHAAELDEFARRFAHRCGHSCGRHDRRLHRWLDRGWREQRPIPVRAPAFRNRFPERIGRD